MESEHPPEEKRKSVWQKTPVANLIRYAPAGTYYLRAKIQKKIVRQSLGTDRFDLAKIKLEERLRELRVARGSSKRGIETIADALAVVRADVANDPSIKAISRKAYFETLDSLKEDGGARAPGGPLRAISENTFAEWWRAAAARYAPQRANHLLMFVQRAIRVAVKNGDLLRNPIADLKPVKIPRKKLSLLTLVEFQKLVESVRSQNLGRRSVEAANYIEFMTYCGMRPAEIAALLWENVDEEKQIIWVYGAAEGTKNMKFRPVPIIPAMAGLLQRMRGDERKVGKIFQFKPARSLKSACKRLGLPHLRVYDLRHMFASTCNASGVDVPTFAGWLGHSDGGALAMKTYVHIHEEHSKKSAAKVKFA